MKLRMKLLGATALLTGLNFSAEAQSRHSSSSVVSNAQNTVQVLRENVRDLRASDIREINSLLREINDIAKGYGGGDHNRPPHGGYPGYPGFPGGGRLDTVTVEIENDEYTWRVRDTRDLLLQCLEARKGRGGNIDDISVSINYRSALKVRNSGWWRGALTVCGELAKLSARAGLQKSESFGPTLVVFSVEDKDSHTHIIRGHSASEIGDKCMRELQYTGTYDDVEININGDTVVRERNTGWWSGTAEACRMVVRAARNHGNIH